MKKKQMHEFSIKIPITLSFETENEERANDIYKRYQRFINEVIEKSTDVFFKYEINKA